MSDGAGSLAGQELAAAVPVSARERLRRMRAGGLWSSQLTAGQQAALSAVGFAPVGQVMGASVWSLNQTGRGACGVYAGSAGSGYATSYGLRPGAGHAEPAVHGAAAHVGKVRSTHMQTLGPLVHTYTRARRSALRRLQGEAAALGADGVVGVRLAVEPFTGSVQRSLSFTALGTAVRSAGSTHLAGPFLSDLDGDQLALLLRAGWAPTGLVMGVGAVVAHDSNTTARGRMAWAGNVELPTYSDLATQARADARDRLNEDIRLHAGEAAVVGDFAVSVHEQACTKARGGAPSSDHVVEAVILGTAISRFDLPAAATASDVLPMIRLSPRQAARRSGPSVVDPFTIRRGH
ncbi:MAG: heavy metal-binding domain-containing protein [Actinobacteria bacterium]|nr:heavy metal-binding domain-containing protein [Actinomycetota bacterium]MCA1720623.1 heavy metal-binding domain-containing protein [Actinomycetota bacterium]